MYSWAGSRIFLCICLLTLVCCLQYLDPVPAEHLPQHFSNLKKEAKSRPVVWVVCVEPCNIIMCAIRNATPSVSLQYNTRRGKELL